jgi:hypothetical protein
LLSIFCLRAVVCEALGLRECPASCSSFKACCLNLSRLALSSLVCSFSAWDYRMLLMVPSISALARLSNCSA